MAEFQEKHRNEELRIKKAYNRDFNQQGRKHFRNKTGQTLGSTNKNGLFLPNIVFETPNGQYTIHGVVNRERNSDLEEGDSDIQVSKGETVSRKGLCLDRNDLMRNFPLSYFENVDLLYKLVGRKRKFHTRSCKNVKKNIKEQQQKQLNSGEKNNSQNINSNQNRGGSLRDKENSLRRKCDKVFTAKKFQVTPSQDKDSSKVVSHMKLRNKNQRQNEKEKPQRQFLNQNSKGHSDSRDTLHTHNNFYPKLNHQFERSKQNQECKVQKDIELMMNQNYSPKLNIESSEKKISRQNITNYIPKNRPAHLISTQKCKLIGQQPPKNRQNAQHNHITEGISSSNNSATRIQGLSRFSPKHQTYRNSQLSAKSELKTDSRALKSANVSKRIDFNQFDDKVIENSVLYNNFDIKQDENQSLNREQDIEDKKTVKMGYESRFDEENTEIQQKNQRTNILIPKIQLNPKEVKSQIIPKFKQEKQRTLVHNREQAKSKTSSQKPLKIQNEKKEQSKQRGKSKQKITNPNFIRRKPKISQKTQSVEKVQDQNTERKKEKIETVSRHQKTNLTETEAYQIKPCVLENTSHLDKKDKILSILQQPKFNMLHQLSNKSLLVAEDLGRQENLVISQENGVGTNNNVEIIQNHDQNTLIDQHSSQNRKSSSKICNKQLSRQEVKDNQGKKQQLVENINKKAVSAGSNEQLKIDKLPNQFKQKEQINIKALPKEQKQKGQIKPNVKFQQQTIDNQVKADRSQKFQQQQPKSIKKQLRVQQVKKQAQVIQTQKKEKVISNKNIVLRNQNSYFQTDQVQSYKEKQSYIERQTNSRQQAPTKEVTPVENQSILMQKSNLNSKAQLGEEIENKGSPETLNQAYQQQAMEKATETEQKQQLQMKKTPFFHEIPEEYQLDKSEKMAQVDEIKIAEQNLSEKPEISIVSPVCEAQDKAAEEIFLDPIRQQAVLLVINEKTKKPSIKSSQVESVDTQEMNHFYNQLIQLDAPNAQPSRFHTQQNQKKEGQNLQTNMKPKACSSEMVIGDHCEVKLVQSSQQKNLTNQDQSLKKTTQKNIDKVLIPFTDSADCISSNSLIKNRPHLNKNISIGSRASIFSLESQNQKATSGGQSQKGTSTGQNYHRKQQKQATILQQFDQEMLNQSGFIHNNKLKRQNKIQETKIVEEKHEYQQHSSIAQSLVMIDLPNNPQKPDLQQQPKLQLANDDKADFQSGTKKVNKNIFELNQVNQACKTPRQSSFFQLNSQEQAQIDRDLHHINLGKAQISLNENIKKLNQINQLKKQQNKQDQGFQFDAPSLQKVVVKSRGSCLKTSKHAQNQFRQQNRKTSKSMKELIKSISSDQIQGKIQQKLEKDQVISSEESIVDQIEKQPENLNPAHQQEKQQTFQPQKQAKIIQKQDQFKEKAVNFDTETMSRDAKKQQKTKKIKTKASFERNRKQQHQSQLMLDQKQQKKSLSNKKKCQNISFHKMYDINIMNVYSQPIQVENNTNTNLDTASKAIKFENNTYQTLQSQKRNKQQVIKNNQVVKVLKDQKNAEFTQEKIEVENQTNQIDNKIQEKVKIQMPKTVSKAQIIDRQEIQTLKNSHKNKIEGTFDQKKTEDITLDKKVSSNDCQTSNVQIENNKQEKITSQNQIKPCYQQRVKQKPIKQPEPPTIANQITQKLSSIQKGSKDQYQGSSKNDYKQIQPLEGQNKKLGENKQKEIKQSVQNQKLACLSQETDIKGQKQPFDQKVIKDSSQKYFQSPLNQNAEKSPEQINNAKQHDNSRHQRQEKVQIKKKLSYSPQRQEIIESVNKSQVKKLKQISCNLQEKYIDADDFTSKKQLNPASDRKIRPKNSLQTYLQKQDIQEQRDQILENYRMGQNAINSQISSQKVLIQSSKGSNFGAEIRRDTLLSSKQGSALKADAQTNTLEPLQDFDEDKVDQDYKQAYSLAKISEYCKNFNLKVHKIPQNNFQLNEKCWEMIKKIVFFIDSKGYFYKRLIDRQSVWLFTDQVNNTFERFKKYKDSANQEQLIKETVRRFLGNKARKEESFIHLSQQRIVKLYFELLFGMPVLLVKSTCYNKLDNLYKHNNIFGFTYGKKTVWRIVGTVQSKKDKEQKLIRLEKLVSKELIQISWQRFLSDFNCSFISGFFQDYYNRAISLPNFKKGKEAGEKFTARLRVPAGGDGSKKQHFLMGAKFQTKNDEEVSGKIMVYTKVKSEKQKQEHFKYLGSGDIFLLSMKLKAGEYLIVVELSSKEDLINSGKILMGSQMKNAEIKLQQK